MTRIQQQHPHGRLCAPLLAVACAAAAVGCDGGPVTDPPTTRASALRTAPFVGYLGGKVISNVKPIAVFWGSNVDPTIQSTLPAMYSAIVSSPYMDWLSEYDTFITGGSNQHIGYGSYGGTFTSRPGTRTRQSPAQRLRASCESRSTTGSSPCRTATPFTWSAFHRE